MMSDPAGVHANVFSRLLRLRAMMRHERFFSSRLSALHGDGVWDGGRSACSVLRQGLDVVRLMYGLQKQDQYQTITHDVTSYQIGILYRTMEGAVRVSSLAVSEPGELFTPTATTSIDSINFKSIDGSSNKKYPSALAYSLAFRG
jgi:hypothetical protein